jgi:hypothetical protein
MSLIIPFDGSVLNSGLRQPAIGRVNLPSSRLARLWRVASSLHELAACAEAAVAWKTDMGEKSVLVGKMQASLSTLRASFLPGRRRSRRWAREAEVAE